MTHEKEYNFMDYINKNSKWFEMQKRLNLQSIGKFIQHGGIINEIDTRSFTEREETAYNNLQKYIEDTCGKENSEDILENITAYSSIKEDICFILGMKAGAQIIAQLTGSLGTDL